MTDCLREIVCINETYIMICELCGTSNLTVSFLLGALATCTYFILNIHRDIHQLEGLRLIVRRGKGGTNKDRRAEQNKTFIRIIKFSMTVFTYDDRLLVRDCVQ